MNSICFNGKFFSADEPVLLASNRGYRYGDGLFETMKVQQGNILILHLCKKNKCEQLGRVRLSVFRGNGGLYDEEKALQYLIECWPLNESVSKLNENGLVIDIYSEAEKSCDKFSNLKSANFLPYSMAALYAKEKKVNDCLVLNSTGSIADSTIANLFVIKNGIIVTPGLDEACVNGVMRRHLLKEIPNAGYDTREVTVSVNDLANADEVFLTNAINGIRWVRQFRDKLYTNIKTTEIYNRFIKTIHT